MSFMYLTLPILDGGQYRNRCREVELQKMAVGSLNIQSWNLDYIPFNSLTTPDPHGFLRP